MGEGLEGYAQGVKDSYVEWMKRVLGGASGAVLGAFLGSFIPIPIVGTGLGAIVGAIGGYQATKHRKRK